MERFQKAKADLQQLTTDLSALLQSVARISGGLDGPLEDWKTTCAGIKKQISEEVIRVAVVGPIKSGKSTFINALLGGDYLKRGAGVVTSIVTRIRRGPYLKATLFFKSWDEVNADIEQALVLFPSMEWRSDDGDVDIRRENDRRALVKALESLNSDLLIANGRRNANGILLDSYLNGYDSVKDVIALENTIKVYEDDQFDEQKAFVGNDRLAVYLKDVQLEIRNGGMEKNIEIADCQGSDSPNPLHLAMIQDYLLKTHLIIYVLSSRTGLRQADIRFLSIIKQMGIIDNMIFVLNCDFSEHESTEELTDFVERTRNELSIIKPDPDIYTLSSLFNLFRSSFKSMSSKDEMRFAQWQAEEPFVAISDRETERFLKTLNTKLENEQYALLLKNNIERLGIIASALQNRSRIYQRVMSTDADDAAQIMHKMSHHREQIEQIETLLKSTLEGSTKKINRETRQAIDRFFDARHGMVLRNIIEFIRSHQVVFESYMQHLSTVGFMDTLFLIYQDFRSAIDRHLADEINPMIISFVREQERKINGFLESVAHPYENMVQEAISEYQHTLDDMGIPLTNAHNPVTDPPDMLTIKERHQLVLPTLEATMRYSARIKTEAVVRLGFYSITNVLQRVIKMKTTHKNQKQIDALKDGVKRMKRETKRSISAHFIDYRENVKFQYLFKLSQTVSQIQYNRLQERFRAYFTDVSQAMDGVKGTQLDKQEAVEVLSSLEKEAKALLAKIGALRKQVESLTTDA